MSLNISPSEAVGSAFPILAADTTYIGPKSAVVTDGAEIILVGGFVNDGDYFELPSSNTDTLDYFDAAGNQIVAGSWAAGLATTEVNAAADRWVGFMLDATDSVVYLCAMTLATQTFFIASIDAAGTIAPKGTGFIPPTLFTVEPTWGPGAATGNATIYRDSDGSGNIFIRGNNSTIATEELELSITTGAVVTDTVQIASEIAHYKTASGIYIGHCLIPANESINRINVASADRTASLYVPISTGAPGTIGGLIPLQWNGRVVVGGTVEDLIGVRASEVSVFNAWADAVAEAGGVTV